MFDGWVKYVFDRSTFNENRN